MRSVSVNVDMLETRLPLLTRPALVRFLQNKWLPLGQLDTHEWYLGIELFRLDLTMVWALRWLRSSGGGRPGSATLDID